MYFVQLCVCRLMLASVAACGDFWSQEKLDLPEAGGADPAPWKRDWHYWASLRCQALKQALDREVHVHPRSSRPEVQLLGCDWFPSFPPRLWQKSESASVFISADKCPVKLFHLHGAGHQRGHQPPQRGLPAGEA